MEKTRFINFVDDLLIPSRGLDEMKSSKSQMKDDFSERKEDEDWIIVKKQKIKIIIPPLSPPNSKIKSPKNKINCNFAKRALPIINSKIATRQFHASILERRIGRLGGMKKWLASIGLERFLGTFKREKLSFYELVGISVKRLKEIGVGPVGPRRKLIHSIEKLYQPV